MRVISIEPSFFCWPCYQNICEATSSFSSPNIPLVTEISWLSIICCKHVYSHTRNNDGNDAFSEKTKPANRTKWYWERKKRIHVSITHERCNWIRFSWLFGLYKTSKEKNKKKWRKNMEVKQNEMQRNERSEHAAICALQCIKRWHSEFLQSIANVYTHKHTCTCAHTHTHHNMRSLLHASEHTSWSFVLHALSFPFGICLCTYVESLARVLCNVQ